DMRRMAGIDFIVAPSSFILGTLGERAERVTGRDAFAINVASRQCYIGSAQPQRRFKTLERLRKAALSDPFDIRFGGVGRSRIRRHAPAVSRLDALLHLLARLRREQ